MKYRVKFKIKGKHHETSLNVDTEGEGSVRAKIKALICGAYKCKKGDLELLYARRV